MEISTRAVYRGQITKLVNAIDVALQKCTVNAESDMDFLISCEEELNVFFDRLKAAYESLNKANICVKPKAEDFVKEAESIAEYDDKAITAISLLNQRLKSIKYFQDRINPTTIPSATPLSPPAPKPLLHLQKLQLKKFSGSFKDWIPFWEQFRSLVHENCTLSAIDKYNYLETALTGKAAETIAGFTPSDANYSSAIALLKEEYGNTDKIIDHTMQQLLAITPIANKSDVSSLRQLYNTVRSTTRSLEHIGVSTSTYFVMLKGVLLRCLPKELRVDFHRYCDDNLKTDEATACENADDCVSIKTVSSSSVQISDKQVNFLLKFLKREVESLEKASEAKTNTNNEMAVQRKTTRTAIGLYVGTNENCCFICKSSDHGIKECDSAMSLAEKKSILQKDGRCFKCCKRGHSAKFCKVRVMCRKCSGRHASCVCDPSFKMSARKSVQQLHSSVSKPLVEKDHSYKSNRDSIGFAESGSLAKNAVNLHSASSRPNDVLLQTACVYVSKENSIQNRSLFTRIVIDGGSQMSFIKRSVSRVLDLPVINTQNLSVLPFGSETQSPVKQYNCVRLTLRSQWSDKAITLDAIEVPEICVDALATPGNIDINKLIHGLNLADNNIKNVSISGISILIGADKYWSVVTGEFRRISGGLTAVKTIFGWTLQGPVTEGNSKNDAGKNAVLNVCACMDVERFWQLESIGILPENVNSDNGDVSELVQLSNNRFIAQIPWKTSQLKQLKDNYNIALIRLKNLVRNLIKAKGLLDYDDAIQEMLCNGFAEKVADGNCSQTKFYLPHRGVYREDKETTKLRIVFDASSHAADALSLNNCIEVGGNFLPEILTVLLNFRCGKIGITADIEKAFLQILLHDNDRDSHRCLWFKTKLNSEDVSFSEIVSYRMTRVTFGIVCSPALLGAALQKLLKIGSKLFPQTYKRLKDAFYMDDLVVSCDSPNEAKMLFNESSTLMQIVSMNLRKWRSRSPEVQNFKDPANLAPPIQKVLGLRWCLVSDELLVDLDSVVKEFCSNDSFMTKRKLLRIIPKIYDPFGVLGPWTVKLKVIFQQTWKNSLPWDENLPGDLMKVLRQNSFEIEQLQELAIPCFTLDKEVATREIHVFADASKHAYGAVAYLRAMSTNVRIYLSFICAKNRIAPLKRKNMDSIVSEQIEHQLTLPKLELTAALLAARLLTYIRQNVKMKIDREFLWSDSQIALHWIIGTKKPWNPYVESRVREVRLKTDIRSWRHCVGSKNPADYLTRGASPKELVESANWIGGPEWLLTIDGVFVSHIQNESEAVSSLSILTEKTSSALETKNVLEPILQAENFSSWRRLLRVTAYILLAIDILKKRKASSVPLLQAEDIERAEHYWILQTQNSYFSDEIAALKQNKGISLQSTILTLNPFLDKETKILRIGSRIPQLSANENVSHPIILPKSSHISKLIVVDIHAKLFHAGASAVLRLRSTFWVIRGRQLVRSVIASCIICKVLKAKAATQPFAPVPRSRVALSRPFYVTGLDFAGPLYIIGSDSSRSKVYFLLFTCAAVRAIHLELTTSLSTESCLLAIRRFIARRAKKLPKDVNLHGVFACNELDLKEVDVYGFDYDYTLACYKPSLHYLLYNLGRNMIIEKFKYPQEISTLEYIPDFAVRGLHYDIEKGLLLKLDSFLQIQLGSVYRGLTKVSDAEVLKLYKNRIIPIAYVEGHAKNLQDGKAKMVQLADLFSVPEICLLCNIAEYFERNHIDYHPEILFHDVKNSVQQCHPVMHQIVSKNVEEYIEANPDLNMFFERLREAGRKLFLVTNSPFHFVDKGMTHLAGDKWRNYFDVIIVQARKPKFFTDESRPIRLFDENTQTHLWDRVSRLEKGKIYYEGTVKQLQDLTGWRGHSVLYFGDHPYSDLADVTLQHGWRTGAIINELTHEINTLNNRQFKMNANWLQMLTQLIEDYQDHESEEAKTMLKKWMKERDYLRNETKYVFNEQFGSVFRTYHNPTYFSRRLFRFADIYTSNITNLLRHSVSHTFYPRRGVMPHEYISYFM